MRIQDAACQRMLMRCCHKQCLIGIDKRATKIAVSAATYCLNIFTCTCLPACPHMHVPSHQGRCPQLS